MTIEEYRKKLKGKLIAYRKGLNLPQNVTFGVEIEYENVQKDLISHLLNEEEFYNPNFVGWRNKTEIDIVEFDENGDEYNGEVTSPILTDKKVNWLNLKKALEIIRNNDGKVTNFCGGHVNIGAHILKNNYSSFINLLLLWVLYEKEIYLFSSGEFGYIRRPQCSSINRSAPELRKKISVIAKGYHTIPMLGELCSEVYDKQHDLCLKYGCRANFVQGNVIEFRIPNPTLREEIFQNYINFFSRLVMTCTKDLDIEKLLYKINHDEHSLVELADLVFGDEIDKENFMIQSLKANPYYKKPLQKHIIRC